MKVRYEPALPDLSYTIQAPLLVDLEGVGCFWAESWSLEGVTRPETVPRVSGKAMITIPFQGFGITLQAELEHDSETDCFRFSAIGQRESEVLTNFYRQLATGRAITMDRMILSMDAPVEKISMEQTPKEAAAETRRTLPRPTRVLTAVAIYALFAFFAYKPVVLPIYQTLSVGPASAETQRN
ncbi:hypothetical protein KZZ07_12290 [Mameliella sp. CS4]|uniref:hypothetical protein n=1 Tax=Mameliella sp. CS4 TaxID=2862329 RepID=UPI001C5EE46F|nr:hypothetical protein [Mameliella sp. CS4]MBW4983323.1 hypothetical protein [Mameliella sp. CS4]